MADMIERLRNMRAAGLAARTQSEYMAAGEAFIRQSDEIIEYVRALESERDFLKAKIDGAAFGEVILCGSDEKDQPRVQINCTVESLSRGPSIYGKRVALVVIE